MLRSFAVSTCLLISVLNVQATQPNSSNAYVAKHLSDARSLTFALRSDAVELTEAAGTGTVVPARLSLESRVLIDMDLAEETARDLLAMRKTAAPAQYAVMSQVGFYLRDLAENTRATIDYLRAEPLRANSDSSFEYVSARRETAERLTILIIDAIDHSAN